ncbi:hypothetical protein ABW21_db0205057 [Orbilia brochopaga]|nr:hypothetical protein ABW21_db0205057 [Drechslerella brochopaga]
MQLDLTWHRSSSTGQFDLDPRTMTTELVDFSVCLCSCARQKEESSKRAQRMVFVDLAASDRALFRKFLRYQILSFLHAIERATVAKHALNSVSAQSCIGCFSVGRCLIDLRTCSESLPCLLSSSCAPSSELSSSPVLSFAGPAVDT